jgi:hypothetical protein
MYWTQVPEDKISEIKETLVALNLTGFLEIQNFDGKFFLQETEDDMSFSDTTVITDCLFPKLAELLKDTPLDGQVIETECQGEESDYLLVNGKSKLLDNFVQEITPDVPIPVGAIMETTLKVKLVGLMDGRAGVLEFITKK